MMSDVWQTVIVEDMLVILIAGIILFLFILYSFAEIHGPTFCYGLKSRSNFKPFFLCEIQIPVFCHSFLPLFWREKYTKVINVFTQEVLKEDTDH